MYPVLAQVQAAQQPTWGPFIVMGLIFFIFYFLIIKPQKQKEAEHQKMLKAIDKNDEVVTIGGIYATVINVKDNSVVLRIADDVKIEVQKSAISGKRNRGHAEEKLADTGRK